MAAAKLPLLIRWHDYNSDRPAADPARPPSIDDIRRAVAVLNRRHHRLCDRWAWTGLVVFGAAASPWRPHHELTPFEAVAVAEKYERESPR